MVRVHPDPLICVLGLTGIRHGPFKAELPGSSPAGRTYAALAQLVQHTVGSRACRVIHAIRVRIPGAALYAAVAQLVEPLS